MAGKIKVPSELVPSQSNQVMLRSKYIYDDVKGHTQEEVNAALEEQIESKVIEAGGVNWDTIPTAGSNNAVKSKDIKAALEKVTGYFVLDNNVTEETVAKTVTVTDFPNLALGGSIKIKMLTKNTADNPTLRIGTSNAPVYPLYYNNEIASASNSWEEGEVISVYFDGTNYQASNALGGRKLSIIHEIDTTTEYTDTDVAGADIVQELREDIYVTHSYTEETITTAETTIGGINNAGSYREYSSTSNYRCTVPIRVYKGTTLSASLACYSDTTAIAFSTEENPSVWDIISLGKGTATSSYNYTFNSDGYVRLTYDSSRAYSFTININRQEEEYRFLTQTTDKVEIDNNDPVTSKGVAEVLNVVIGNYSNMGRVISVVSFASGYVHKGTGAIKSSQINSHSKPINVEGYKKIAFVANYPTSSSIGSDDGAAFYSSNILGSSTFISGVPYDYTAPELTYKQYLIDVPENAKYFSFTINNEFVSNAGTVILFKEKDTVDGRLDSISNNINVLQNKISNIEAEPLTWTDGKQIYTNEGVGNTCKLSTYNTESYRCLNVDITEGQKVLITNASGGSSPRLWCFLNASNVILDVADANSVAENLELTAPEGTAKIIINDNRKLGEVYVYTEDKPLSLKVSELGNVPITIPGRTSNCKDFGIQPAANGTDGSFCDITHNGYDALLEEVYEPLRTANPNYISRVNIGKDASGTIDMYAYVFEPRYYQQSVYLQAGIHGKEVDAVACLARIMQLITNATDADEDLMWLRQNIKFTIIPCVNVWGISQATKNNNNSDGSALQQWSTSTPPTEVANVKAYIESVALIDELSFMLDMHTTTNDSYYDFYGNVQRHAKNVRTIYRTNAWLCNNYAKDGRTVDDQYLGYHEYADNRLFRLYYYYKYGVQTATLELSDYHWDSALSTSKVITMGVTMWLNYIIQMVNDFYRSKSDIPDEDYRESRG